jgi:hypothetical protein
MSKGGKESSHERNSRHGPERKGAIEYSMALGQGAFTLTYGALPSFEAEGMDWDVKAGVLLDIHSYEKTLLRVWISHSAGNPAEFWRSSSFRFVFAI